MTRVLHVFGTMDIGGAELRTIELLRELGPRGVEFEFVALSGNAGALDAEIRSLGGAVHPLKLDLSFPLRFWRLLRRIRPDAIDSHVATFSGVLLFGAWLGGVDRRIAHFRSDGDGHPDTGRRRVQRGAMVQLIRWFATDIVGVSPSALTDGYRPDWRNDTRVRVIVNGISPFTPEHGPGRLRALVGATDDAVLLCHVGRPSAEKNRVYTVRVLRALRDRGVDAYLALVGGTGPDSADVQAEVRSLDVEAFVHDLGSRRDARILMSEADVMILTSVREGLPGVVLESLSTGTPVVASALPGVEFIAASLRGIRVLGLDEPVSEWARAVQSSIADALVEGWRDRLRRDFDASEFAQVRATRQHLSLYRGGEE